MVGMPLATPPSTAATSPTLPTSPTGDCVIDIGKDPEKAGCDEKRLEADESRAAVGEGSWQFSPTALPPGWRPPELIEADSVNTNFQTKFKPFWRKQSFSASLPQVPWRRRKSDGREKLVQRIDDHPRGYPQLAAFIDSDENFLMCRRFGFLHSRVLLYRQDELTKLEKNLIAMDEEDNEIYPLALLSRKTDDARDEEFSRKSLINTIDKKLKEYDDIVQRIKSFGSLRKPSNRNYNSFASWIVNTKPLSREEMIFVKHSEDFVALADGQEGGWLDGFVEDCLSYLPHQFAQTFLSSPEQRSKSDDAYVHLYSKYRIDVLVRLILTIITVLLLMAPTVLLFRVTGHWPLKISLIILFTLLFSAALGVFTKAKRHEMFAASAA